MNEPYLEELNARPLPEVATALRDGAEKILAQWRAVVVRVLPQADELTRKQLENSIPKLLSELADALEATGPREASKLIADAPGHGETRFHQSFKIEELIVEYQILRTALMEQLRHELGRDLTLHESVGVNGGVDVAMRRAVTAFSAHQAEQLRAEAESFSQYLSFLSHDLRGGLNSAILMMELLKRDLAAEPKFAQSIDDLDLMRRSMLDTAATMDRFLHAERLRRGKTPIRIGEVDLNELVNHVVRSGSYQIPDPRTPAAKPQVQVVLDGAPPVKSDRDALVIILQNLLSNAIKYGGEKPVTIKAEGREQGAVRVSVQDRGPGIDPQRAAQLFAPFSRGETYGKKGVGLGLAIARQTAELIGGTLSVESRLGDGATFHLDLPAQPPASS